MGERARACVCVCVCGVGGYKQQQSLARAWDTAPLEPHRQGTRRAQRRIARHRFRVRRGWIQREMSHVRRMCSGVWPSAFYAGKERGDAAINYNTKYYSKYHTSRSRRTSRIPAPRPCRAAEVHSEVGANIARSNPPCPAGRRGVDRDRLMPKEETDTGGRGLHVPDAP